MLRHVFEFDHGLFFAEEHRVSVSGTDRASS
jgi:hypothetical protein